MCMVCWPIHVYGVHYLELTNLTRVCLACVWPVYIWLILYHLNYILCTQVIWKRLYNCLSKGCVHPLPSPKFNQQTERSEETREECHTMWRVLSFGDRSSYKLRCNASFWYVKCDRQALHWAFPTRLRKAQPLTALEGVATCCFKDSWSVCGYQLPLTCHEKGRWSRTSVCKGSTQSWTAANGCCTRGWWGKNRPVLEVLPRTIQDVRAYQLLIYPFVGAWVCCDSQVETTAYMGTYSKCSWKTRAKRINGSLHGAH